jgi:hypothetical protein
MFTVGSVLCIDLYFWEMLETEVLHLCYGHIRDVHVSDMLWTCLQHSRYAQCTC